MSYPALINYNSIDKYINHFNTVYCKEPILTFDDIPVYFSKYKFNHYFKESTYRNGMKDEFSNKRLPRIDWIKKALQDCSAEFHMGWLKEKQMYIRERRVALVQINYVVIVALINNKNKKSIEGKFVTAYVADTPRTLEQIKKAPIWSPPDWMNK